MSEVEKWAMLGRIYYHARREIERAMPRYEHGSTDDIDQQVDLTRAIMGSLWLDEQLDRALNAATMY